ncbi:MAG: NfeD family protein [Lachnospiraceae bacterium]|nr:NfeD family protein [Lachnospiraceae bacterium]
MGADVIFWLVCVVIFAVAEIATMGLTTIWFAIGSLVALFLALFGANVWIQVIVFILVSLVMILFTRPIAVKYFNTDRVRTNAESLIGRQAIVTQAIDNLHATGKVMVAGQEWTARSDQDDILIEEGAVTDILAINGVKLIVKEREK